GMYFDERRAHFLQDRLHRRLKQCGLDTFYSYYRLLTSHEGKAELAALLENLTVNETSFFRNKPQLELFHKVILEDLLHRKQERQVFQDDLMEQDRKSTRLNSSHSQISYAVFCLKKKKKKIHNKYQRKY